jgi:hypothetical protein
MTRQPAGASAWTLHDMAQRRQMMKARAPLRIAALRLGRSEASVRSKLVQLSGRSMDSMGVQDAPVARRGD